MIESKDEIKLEYTEKMGDKLGEYFSLLRDKTIWLNLLWREYKVLFGTNPETIDLLNRNSPRFFYLVEEILFDKIILEISKMMDLPETRIKNITNINLTFGLLQRNIEEGLNNNISDLFVNLEEMIRGIKLFRNKIIGHNDLLSIISERVDVSIIPCRNILEEIISLMAKILNEISEYYGVAQTVYDYLAGYTGGATSLLSIMSSYNNDKIAE